MRKRLLSAFLCVVLALLALPIGTVQAQDSPPAAAPLIIDTDMASDDWMAILFLLKNPDFDVKAITVTGAAFADCDAGVAAALGLVALAEYGDVPVSCWKDEPLRGGAVRVPLEWRTTMSAVEALGLPEGGEPAEQDAVELFTATVEASEQPITVLALGGFTNIAAAFEAKPTLVDNIERIYAMGGAVDVEGSQVSDTNTTAEWNIYADPTAARIVFESGVPITLIGLDATNLVPITMDFFERLGETKASPEAEFVYKVLEGRQESIQGGYDYFWDPLAAGVLADPSLVTLTDRNLVVVDEDGPEQGRTKPVDAGEGNVIQAASE
ncbi:MAG: nucleoside hydrolase, partial [Anaerolineae bacterium]|nr:nucleoside hydrolase [Anaerolineae bacterium]